MKLRAKSKEEQLKFCKLANCDYPECHDIRTKTVQHCSIWEEIDWFKQTLLKIKYKKQEKAK